MVLWETAHNSECVEAHYQIVITTLIFLKKNMNLNDHLSYKLKWEVDITKVSEHINIYKKLTCPVLMLNKFYK